MKDELIELINSEIEFSSRNYEEYGVTEEQAEWFVKGLESARLIIDNYYGFIKEH